MVKSFYERMLAEIEEVQTKDCDEQLAEAYEHISKKNIKKLHDFLIGIMSACDQIVGEAKLNKAPRAKKVKPAEDLVKKLKFKASDDKLGVTSVPPAQIVGAQGAVVYNTKTRKIGIYTSLSSAGLAVKGTTITNFTDKSTQKTLRKPELQLREFKEQNTNKRVETWFKNIKATEVNLNGRLNAETMILKVFK
jgi:DNA-directed RNA polymerase beta' subunit